MLSDEQIELNRSVYREEFEYLLKSFDQNIESATDFSLKMKSPVTKFNNKIINTLSRQNINETEYPNLTKKLNDSALISMAETITFLKQNGFDETSFASFAENNRKSVLDKLEEFFAPISFTNNSIGTFCALVPNIFVAFSEFQDLAQDIIDGLENLPILLAKGFAGFILALKEKLFAIIDNLIQGVLDFLENFGIEFIDGESVSNQERIISKIESNKESIRQKFSKENQEKLKKAIELKLAEIITIFEDPDIEEVQYLILRACRFISELEFAINSNLSSLRLLVANYRFAKDRLKSVSGLSTSRAIAAGAIR